MSRLMRRPGACNMLILGSTTIRAKIRYCLTLTVTCSAILSVIMGILSFIRLPRISTTDLTLVSKYCIDIMSISIIVYIFDSCINVYIVVAAWRTAVDGVHKSWIDTTFV